MRLYYTSISGEDLPQTRPDLSLGGFRSGTPVPNDTFSNLFSDISCYSISENRDEYIGIALRNETGALAENVILYLNYPVDGAQKIIEMAFVAFNASDEMEIIPSAYSKPFVGEFNPANGELNAINIGDIVNGEQIGIWFKRIIDQTAIEQEYSNANLIENGTPQEANEDIVLVITYNFATSTTDTVTSIAQTTATSGGEVLDDGGTAVVARGVCWSTEEIPTIDDSLTSDGVGLGVFVSSLTGLLANTVYYVRSYATNTEGTSYGDQETFTTLP